MRGLSAASSFFVLAALSVYQFGLYQLILAAVAIAGSFASGFFDDIISNEIARALAEGKPGWAKRLFLQFFASKALLAFLAAGILFLGADLVARYYDRDMAGFIRIASALALLGPLRAAESLFFSATRSFAAFGAGAIQEVVRLLALAAFWVWGALGLGEVLVASVIAALTVLGYTSFFFFREYRRRFWAIPAEPGKPLWGLIRGYGLWLSLRFGITRSLKGTDVWIVRLFLNTEAVAFYALVINLISFVQSMAPTAILGTLLPWEVKDRQRLQHIYRRMMKYGFFFGIALAVGAFFAVPFAIELFFPKYLTAMPLFRLMLIAMPFFVVYKFQKIFLIVLREQKILALRRMGEELLTLGVLALFLPIVGLFAVVVSFLVVYASRVALLTLYLSRHYPELRLKLRHIFSFDRDDLKVGQQILREVVRPRRWLGSIQP